ncbi:IS110 family transposase [Dictyobacter aurantiacus]|uniref:IS110 family transposase n=1 Tax=Dictyobacter aurantiacus TaxID=1936993 RepID=A0A401ZAY3_9CHLR|nr:IS110 family transposase [Dictyobacter aurantiacus]GCE03158.1 IS110 family transposase [Dictyobacter aurantiacus]GCE03767.1 IS110 family transposase [Dictyobacter aurantiacus]GCE04037.1 IS110 family transposase [Dictyobacter aurantiacus]GCE04729.1 IS110 family transposase [Dictyobacter aurantiacus]GCE05279.1 IS110 family transposase [Dictyobacter aurantiacus]
MWYAGIDWANAHHDVLVIDDAGRQVGSLRVNHTPEGLHHLNAFLEDITGPDDRDQMACIIETSRGLLITALLEAGWHVYPVHPKTVDRRRPASGVKTDALDAYLLAKHGRAELVDLRRLKPDSDIIAELKALTRDQDSLIQSQTRLVNQLTACLKAYYPVALQLFAKLQQHSTLMFLQTYPTPQAAMGASVQEIEVTLRQGRHTNPTKAAPLIFQRLHQSHLTADAITTRTKSRLMLVQVKQLLPLVEEIAEYDKVIEDLFLTHADSPIFSSLPRAGKRLAPRLLAEIGDERSRYLRASNLQALAGTSPVIFQSGTYAKAHRRYACSKPLRNALHQFAWQSTQQEPWARDYYLRKRSEGKSHTEAVRALSNLWVRILFALWSKHECYDAAIFQSAKLAHAPRAA